MNPLSWLVPAWAPWALAAALAGALGVQSYRVASHQHALDQLRADVATTEALRQATALKAAEQFRSQEHTWDTTQRKVLDVATQTGARDRDDHASASAAGAGLHFRAVTFASGGSPTQDPTTGSTCSPATDTAVVLANVLSSVVEEAVRYAAIADERGLAGGTCQQLYDALTTDTVGIGAAPQQ